MSLRPMIAAAILVTLVAVPAATAAPAKPNVILITLDTTRADAVGGPATPNINAVAARGIRYARAYAPAPLTLPSHASLLTGVDPPAHGVHANGTEALPASIPTLATILKSAGYTTAAFVSSRVLDRRFGMGRGFDVYDDLIVAEQIGEAGYAERNAEQVTTAALTEMQKRKGAAPFFLWVHYYDPHSPYVPPQTWRGRTDVDNYHGEIRYMDAEVGRLLKTLAPRADDIVAIVGDHGESLGEHGELTHGIFLYASTLQVPMIVAGASAPKGKVIDEAVGIVRLTRTILQFARVAAPASMQPALPGTGRATPPMAVYSETEFPLTAYGWSALKAYSDQRWRAVFAPKPELYDMRADPKEKKNAIDDNRREFFRLQRERKQHEESLPQAKAAQASTDPDLAADLRSLGYLSGAAKREGTLDPKEGVALLAEFDRADDLLLRRKPTEAAAILTRLVERNPTNIHFITSLAKAQWEAGSRDEAMANYRRAVELNPHLDFLHLNLGDALRRSGKNEDAAAEYRLALSLNPRLAAAVIHLAEMSLARGKIAEARQELQRGINAGVHSASILTRLARIDLQAGDAVTAEKNARAAVAVAHRWAPAWVLLGELQQRRGETADARRSLQLAIEFDPVNAEAWLAQGKLLRKAGSETEARRSFRRVLELSSSSSPFAVEARKLLGE